MTDAMPTNRLIEPAGRTQGPLAVGDRRQRQKRETPTHRSRAKADRQTTVPEQDDDQEKAHGRAIDIRV